MSNASLISRQKQSADLADFLWKIPAESKRIESNHVAKINQTILSDGVTVDIAYYTKPYLWEFVKRNNKTIFEIIDNFDEGKGYVFTDDGTVVYAGCYVSDKISEIFGNVYSKGTKNTSFSVKAESQKSDDASFTVKPEQQESGAYEYDAEDYIRLANADFEKARQLSGNDFKFDDIDKMKNDLLRKSIRRNKQR